MTIKSFKVPNDNPYLGTKKIIFSYLLIVHHEVKAKHIEPLQQDRRLLVKVREAHLS